jgi:transcriptional regulator of arginine metabolism
MNPAARKQLVSEILTNAAIESQEELVRVLKKRGVDVTQTTASRDLLELGALRGKDASGRFRYILGGAVTKSDNRSRNLLLSTVASGNLVIAKTPPGGAQLLAGQIDAAIAAGDLRSAIGSIAGDDTVMVVAKTPSGGNTLAKELNALLDGEPVKSIRKARNNSTVVNRTKKASQKNRGK